jgi:hypothetical protein
MLGGQLAGQPAHLDEGPHVCNLLPHLAESAQVARLFVQLWVDQPHVEHRLVLVVGQEVERRVTDRVRLKVPLVQNAGWDSSLCDEIKNYVKMRLIQISESRTLAP